MAIKFDIPGKKVAFSAANNAAGFSAAASAGASADHTRLRNRDAADQHPMSAITGLSQALENAGYDDTSIQQRISAIEGKESVWDAKYTKPVNGISRTDLSATVKTSLNKADSALQEVPEGYATESYVDNHHDSTKQDTLTPGDNITIEEGVISAAAGRDGHSPVVKAVRHPQLPRTLIFVDGVQQTYIKDGDTGAQGEPGADGQNGRDGQDGHTPVITATKSGTVTTVRVDGKAIATINDGARGPQGPQGEPGSGMEVAVGYLDYPLVPNTRYALGDFGSTLMLYFPYYAEPGDVIEIGWTNQGEYISYNGSCYPEVQFDDSYLYCQLRAVYDNDCWWISKSGVIAEY